MYASGGFSILTVHGLGTGNGDGVVPLSDVPAVSNVLTSAASSAASSTMCVLELLPGVDHNFQAEGAKEKLCEAVVGWVDKHLLAQAAPARL